MLSTNGVALCCSALANVAVVISEVQALRRP